MKLNKRIAGLLFAGLVSIGFSVDAATSERSINNSVTNMKKAPEFSYESIHSDKKVGIKDLKGKYVLIDFWASWCPPCHAAVPFLKDAYTKYQDKGLEILGVSIDGNKKAWENAVEKKQMNWKHVLATDEGKAISKLYNFNAIPYFVLVDQSGNIVAEGFEAKELDAILAGALK